MDVLDDIRERQANVKPYNTAMRYGLIAGGISIVLGLVLYLLEIVNQNMSYINYVVLFIIIFMAAVYHRDKELNGKMLYGRGLGVGVLTSLCTGLIGALWTYIFMAFIAPEYGDVLLEQGLEQAHEQWEAAGMSEEQMEAAEEWTVSMFTPPALTMISLFFTIFIGFIGSLIIAAITQRK